VPHLQVNLTRLDYIFFLSPTLFHKSFVQKSVQGLWCHLNVSSINKCRLEQRMVSYRCHQTFVMVFADPLGQPTPTAVHFCTYPAFL